MMSRKIMIVCLSIAIIIASIVGCRLNNNQKDVSIETTENLMNETTENEVVKNDDQETIASLETDFIDKGEDLIIDLIDNKIEEQEKENNYDANEDSVLNEYGGLDIPFDEAYPEVFEEGNIAYSEDTLLVKLSNSMNGTPTSSMKQAGIVKLEKLFETSNHVWYEAYVNEDVDLKETMRSIRQLEEVVEAEYNFVYETTATDMEELEKELKQNKQYSDQWHLDHCGIKDAWNYAIENDMNPGGDPSVVVAVIDTGVDYTHKDLAANMWKNVREIENNGIDDDGNGYIDDYYGVDITAGRNSGMDDQGHGTHVAGIISAVNNKEGVVGIAYNTQIMTIKAGNNAGQFQ